MRAIIILLALIAVAHAEALPKKKVGTCPAGYSQPGGFCARDATGRSPLPSRREPGTVRAAGCRAEVIA
jgi:hypothetical protein